MKEKEIKNIFIDSQLETNVCLYCDKSPKDLNREDYITYFKHVNKEMINTSKYIIRFLGSIRGTAIEVLKEENNE